MLQAETLGGAISRYELLLDRGGAEIVIRLHEVNE
jgi:hypothetical protein